MAKQPSHTDPLLQTPPRAQLHRGTSPPAFFSANPRVPACSGVSAPAARYDPTKPKVAPLTIMPRNDTLPPTDQPATVGAVPAGAYHRIVSSTFEIVTHVHRHAQALLKWWQEELERVENGSCGPFLAQDEHYIPLLKSHIKDLAYVVSASASPAQTNLAALRYGTERYNALSHAYDANIARYDDYQLRVIVERTSSIVKDTKSTYLDLPSLQNLGVDSFEKDLNAHKEPEVQEADFSLKLAQRGVAIAEQVIQLQLIQPPSCALFEVSNANSTFTLPTIACSRLVGRYRRYACNALHVFTLFARLAAMWRHTLFFHDRCDNFTRKQRESITQLLVRLPPLRKSVLGALSSDPAVLDESTSWRQDTLRKLTDLLTQVDALGRTIGQLYNKAEKDDLKPEMKPWHREAYHLGHHAFVDAVTKPHQPYVPSFDYSKTAAEPGPTQIPRLSPAQFTHFSEIYQQGRAAQLINRFGATLHTGERQ